MVSTQRGLRELSSAALWYFAFLAASSPDVYARDWYYQW